MWTFGYNVAVGGGKVVSTEPTLALHFESFYIQNGTVGDPQVLEWHLETVSVEGTARRPITGQFPRNDGAARGTAGMSFNCDYYSINDWTQTQKIKIDFASALGTTQISLN